MMACGVPAGVWALCLAAGAGVLVPARTAAGAEPAPLRLERLAADAHQRELDLFPVAETMGASAGPRQDRLELTFTAEHRERQRAHHHWVLTQLDGIAPDELAPSERITHRLLAHESRDSLEWLQYPFHQHYIFIHLGGGVANNLIRLVARQPFRNEADYRAWFARLRRYPEYLDGTARVMRDGIEAGITIPRVIVERALSQLESLAPDAGEMEKSALWKPMMQFPATLDAAARARLEAEYRKLLAEEVFPAIRVLAAFARSEYLPRARTTDGFYALPRGAEMYRLAVRSETTTNMSPDEIHDLGLREVKRIQAALLKAGARAGFAGPMADLPRWIREDPGNYPFGSASDVIEYLYRIHARIVPQLPRLFGRVPKARFEIRLTEPELAGSAPAQWHPPSDDGTRPGVFTIPVVNPKDRSSFGLAALLAHEGMPGHHFDGSIKLENQVPEFRRRLWINAFGEGWGLYAEYLGHELGLYDDPRELMGRYAFELLRACRLVVDTGLHAKRWPREAAIRYFVDECGSRETDATSEVLRYMVWPAQALGYKIGELAILEMRAAAERRLGKRFDLRRFHDAFLAEGHLPLSMARERMEAWLEAQSQP
jgi:uncharacterized protein (DUF885 family)